VEPPLSAAASGQRQCCDPRRRLDVWTHVIDIWLQEDSPLTSSDILRLYEKLNAIERETRKDITLATASAVLAADRRGRSMTRSTSSAAGGADEVPGPATAETELPTTAKVRRYYDAVQYNSWKMCGKPGVMLVSMFIFEARYVLTISFVKITVKRSSRYINLSYELLR